MPTLDHCLRCRGFLLETAPSGNCRLTEDAHAEDAAALQSLLEACRLTQAAGFNLAAGEFPAAIPATEKTRRIIATTWERCKNETGYRGEQEEWSSFRQLKHGIKVPVCQLEPGVALLVKALNTVGAVTWSSCETHAEICFLGSYAAAWAKFLIVDWAGADPAVFVFNGTVLTITTSGGTLLDLTAMPAAQIYTHRQPLRSLRTACMDQWPADQPPAADAFYRLVRHLHAHS